MNSPHLERGGLPIREVTRLTGVHPVTLRAWERRYGLVVPQRTGKGTGSTAKSRSSASAGYSSGSSVASPSARCARCWSVRRKPRRRMSNPLGTPARTAAGRHRRAGRATPRRSVQPGRVALSGSDPLRKASATLAAAPRTTLAGTVRRAHGAGLLLLLVAQQAGRPPLSPATAATGRAAAAGQPVRAVAGTEPLAVQLVARQRRGAAAGSTGRCHRPNWPWPANAWKLAACCCTPVIASIRSTCRACWQG